MIDYRQLNGVTLAYLGDAVWELYVRQHLLEQGLTKVNRLQQRSTHFVSAKSQAALIALMKEQDYLKPEELEVFKRGRNAKSYTHAKNTSVQTYNISTGFEALFGYLKVTQQEQRLQEMAQWCLDQVEAGNTDGFNFQ